MIKVALGFVFGAWLLQQQAALPSQALTIGWLLAIIPVLFLLVKSPSFSFKYSDLLQKISVLIVAGLLGFMWAATLATIRLNDELPADWQQKSINIVGVIATLPEITEKGERFQFDVENTLMQGAKIPRHISLNFYAESNLASTVNHFHAGERWQFAVKLKRPHSTYNPHGYDFEGWALENNIRATGSISNKPRFSIRTFQGVKTGLNVTGRSKDFDLSHTPSNH